MEKEVSIKLVDNVIEHSAHRLDDYSSSNGIIREYFDAVLVDDDLLVRMVWNFSAKECQKKIKVFSDPEALLKELPHVDSRTPIYIDSQLGNGVKGQELALELYRRGFLELYLCTGFPKQSFSEMHWIKDIQGKEPPQVWSQSKL